MFHGFSQSDVLVTTEIFLIGYLCEEVSDPENCAYGIAKWWGVVAPLIFSEKSSTHICHEMNPECSILAKSWNCESCTNQVELFNQIMSSSKFANFIVKELSSRLRAVTGFFFYAVDFASTNSNFERILRGGDLESLKFM